MASKLFGTDGIRGLTNQKPMTAEIAMRVGMAAGRRFLRGDHKHRVVIGKDTRVSCYMVESALTAGFTSVGMDVVLVGVMPTPAVAMLTKSLKADIGVMISASHNPYHDNGIKIFGPDGYKLSDGCEAIIEDYMNSEMSGFLAAPDGLGRAKRLEDARGRYIEFAKRSFPSHLRLDGLKIVVDCANGAPFRVAPTVLWELGADVEVLGVTPNGFNINDGCGSTAVDQLSKRVQEVGADIGIALDGDADRLILVDEKGHTVDGDQLMALISRSWQQEDKLRGNGVVATVMSNLGFERYLETIGLAMVRTKVGDRYVVEHMRRHGYNIGGEQSGHIILNDFTTTGDGIIAALQVLAAIVGLGKPASEVCNLFQPLPQLLKNVRYGDTEPLSDNRVIEAIRDAERRLGNAGRVLIRKSGTEPLVRVMAEGDDHALVEQIVDHICDRVREVA
ncbi:MAG: phosphoglucosamine mutase [Pseudomonadota bacterium]